MNIMDIVDWCVLISGALMPMVLILVSSACIKYLFF
jgi:hypothetical protein